MAGNFLYSLNTLAAIIGALGAALASSPGDGFCADLVVAGRRSGDGDRRADIPPAKEVRVERLRYCGAADGNDLLNPASSRTHVIGKFPGKIIEIL